MNLFQVKLIIKRSHRPSIDWRKEKQWNDNAFHFLIFHIFLLSISTPGAAWERGCNERDEKNEKYVIIK